MRPHKEVIIYDNLSYMSESSSGYGGRLGLKNLDGCKLGSNSAGVYKLWGGSIDQFINDFEIPTDYIDYWKTKTSDTTSNAIEIVDGKHNTINFKINLEFWFRLSANTSKTNFAPCANLSFPITVPNFLYFNVATVGAPNQDNWKAYNPNVFPIVFTASSWANSNKSVSAYNGNTWGTISNGTPVLVFRYNVDGQDIQICIANLSTTSWEANSSPIYLARASLTFTGFNATKKVSRV